MLKTFFFSFVYVKEVDVPKGMPDDGNVSILFHEF